MEYSRFKFCRAITRGTLITLRDIPAERKAPYFLRYMKKKMNNSTELPEIAVNTVDILFSTFLRKCRKLRQKSQQILSLSLLNSVVKE